MKKNLNVYFKLLYKIFDECMRYKKCMDAKFFTQKVLLCLIFFLYDYFFLFFI
jgi:hypothetical protein